MLRNGRLDGGYWCARLQRFVLMERVQSPISDVHETSARDVPGVIESNFRGRHVYGWHATIGAFLAWISKVYVEVVDFAASDTGRVAECVAEAVCCWMGAQEKVAPRCAHCRAEGVLLVDDQPKQPAFSVLCLAVSAVRLFIWSSGGIFWH